MEKIWILDDDIALGQLLSAFLQQKGYEVEHFLKPSLVPLDTKPHLFILDGMLPEKDGLEVLQEWKAKSEKTPVLMLSARGDVEDRIKGLEFGAEDYLPKPFDPRELLARIKSLLKRNPNTTPSLQWQGLQILKENRQVLFQGNSLDITTMEFDILLTLASTPFKVFSRDELLDICKGIQVEIFSRSIDICISRIRQKLKTVNLDSWIQTVRGSGYQWSPPKEVL